MYRSVKTYTMNTILTKDLKIKNKREAVLKTIKLIAQVAQKEPEVHLTLKDYNQLLK